MALVILFMITLMASSLISSEALKQLTGHTELRDHYFIHPNHIHNITECPTWQLWNKTSNSCECGNALDGLINCNKVDKSLKILACYCMTESKLLNKIVVGNCLYTCTRKYWTRLPNEPSELDNATCQPFKRTGQFCGDCIDNHAPPAYSYTIECVKCTSFATKYNWLKYIAVAFIPLTIFYFIIITFRISVSEPKLRGYILICQIISMPSHLRYLSTLHKSHSTPLLVNVIVSSISIWNLEFFRVVYNPFCIHPNVGPLGVLALDYVTAIYPLCLIFATYFCVKLHDNYSWVRQLLKPFYWCCFHFRKEWKIHHSLTDAFGTFLLLSYVKILNISFDLLLSTKLYDINGTVNINFLYYSGTVQIFKGEHIPFAILAIIMLIVFNIIPLILLCCYPCQCFHKLINSCTCRCQTLHVFMDIFHGCYRTKPVDYRYFSALYLLLRIINLIVFSFTLSRFYYPFAAILILLTAVTVIITQPYKLSVYNKLESSLFIVFACALIPATAYALSPSDKWNGTFIAMISLVAVLLVFYVVILIIYWAIPLRIKEAMKRGIRQICRHQQTNPESDDFLETISTTRVSQTIANASTPLLTHS